jgi:hypothetical protein
MQRLTVQFQEYLHRINANPAQHVTGEVLPGLEREENTERPDAENQPDGNAAPTPPGRLRIKINWQALGLDRQDQTIRENQSSDSIVKLLVELIGVFGESLKQQLTELPVVRYPLSRRPAVDFVNASTGQQFSSIPLPETDLHFCPQSDNREKVKRLSKLVSRLTLPDGRDFPERSIEFSIDADPLAPALLA